MARILVIDDEPVSRLVLAKSLRHCGHHVETAADGTEGLALVQTQPVDFVFTDLLMPGKGGVELIYELARTHPEVKVIAVSAAFDYFHAARQVGAFRVIRKPFSMDEINAALAAVDGNQGVS